jgi:hypothetical protein
MFSFEMAHIESKIFVKKLKCSLLVEEIAVEK